LRTKQKNADSFATILNQAAAWFLTQGESKPKRVIRAKLFDKVFDCPQNQVEQEDFKSNASVSIESTIESADPPEEKEDKKESN